MPTTPKDKVFLLAGGKMTAAAFKKKLAEIDRGLDTARFPLDAVRDIEALVPGTQDIGTVLREQELRLALLKTVSKIIATFNDTANELAEPRQEDHELLLKAEQTQGWLRARQEAEPKVTAGSSWEARTDTNGLTPVRS